MNSSIQKPHQLWIDDPLFSKDVRDKVDSASLHDIESFATRLLWKDAVNNAANKANTDPELKELMDKAVIFYLLKYGNQ